MDLMTPSRKRILRERAVEPSTKAKKMHGQKPQVVEGAETVGNEVVVANGLQQPNHLVN